MSLNIDVLYQPLNVVLRMLNSDEMEGIAKISEMVDQQNIFFIHFLCAKWK